AHDRPRARKHPQVVEVLSRPHAAVQLVRSHRASLRCTPMVLITRPGSVLAAALPPDGTGSDTSRLAADATSPKKRRAGSIYPCEAAARDPLVLRAGSAASGGSA